jgi:nicotinamidase-related amidase
MTGKNVLLVIDPQKDFTDVNKVVNGKAYEGRLSVKGAAEDYTRIISMLDKANFDEIHVTLDTHTDKHIGHPGFWELVSIELQDKPQDEKQDEGVQSNTDVQPAEYVQKVEGGAENVIDAKSVPNSIYELSVVEDVITGTNIVPKEFNKGTPYQIIVKPRNAKLTDYVKKYIEWFTTDENKHKQNCCIWFQHCIEQSEGHRIYEHLHSALNRRRKGSVKYHIKGQNNLAEMYSIFKAERPVSDKDMNDYKEFVYTGVNKVGVNKNDGTDGTSDSYYTVKDKVNLKTDLNKYLLKELLGTPEKPNKVYICGEARTHCVKSSVVDLMEYVKDNGLDMQNVIIITDGSSPIDGATDDIIDMVKDKGGKTLRCADVITALPKRDAYYMQGTVASDANANVKRGGKRTKRNQKNHATKKQSAGKKNKSRRYRRKMTKHNW